MIVKVIKKVGFQATCGASSTLSLDGSTTNDNGGNSSINQAAHAKKLFTTM